MTYFFRKFKLDKNTIHVISLSCNTVPPVAYGGIELIVANLCLGLNELGAKVTCYSPGELALVNVAHIKTIDKPSLSVKLGGEANSTEHLSATLNNLKRKVKRGDIVIFNHPEQFRKLKNKLGLSFRLKTNILEIAHTIDAGVYRNVIYPSHQLKEVIAKKGVVIHHGINLKFSENKTKRKKYLFYAGSIDPDKGVHIALAACEAIGCNLLIAGPRNFSQYEKNIINSSSVMYLGELSYEELFKFYEEAFGFIYMTQIPEPFGLAVIEAMAAGCPVITTGLGGTGETVLNNSTGFFCRTVTEVIHAYKMLPEIDAEKCISRAKSFSVEKMCSEYLDYISGNL